MTKILKSRFRKESEIIDWDVESKPIESNPTGVDQYPGINSNPTKHLEDYVRTNSDDSVKNIDYC